MTEYTPLQKRLIQLRDERCGGNTSELARQIGKDSTYLRRLLYPADKPGARGIGLEIMAACNEAFDLEPGFWDGVKAYWPFTDELHKAVVALNPTELTRTENVIRSHLGLGQVPFVANDEQAAGAKPVVSDTAYKGADPVVRSGLAVVRSEKPPSTATPALDAEDARHRKTVANERRKAGPSGPGKPENSGNSH